MDSIGSHEEGSYFSKKVTALQGEIWGVSEGSVFALVIISVLFLLTKTPPLLGGVWLCTDDSKSDIGNI